MRWVSSPVIILAFAFLAQGFGQTSKVPPKPSEAAQAGVKKPGKTVPAHPTAISRTGSRRRSGRARPAAPSYQLHPDPERYQQIQQALADKGYFKGEVNGAWGDDSVDALKRFQADQKLQDDGKISALTLSGLGLGPRHDADRPNSPAASTTSPPPSTPPATSPPGSQTPPSPPK